MNQHNRVRLDNMHQLNSRVIWLTGVSGSGKTTIANTIKDRLLPDIPRICILDGDELRAGINSDLGFSEADRSESTRRACYIANILVQEKFLVIVSMISPYRTDRDKAKHMFRTIGFFEIYLHAPMSVFLQRDPKGLYQKVLKGEIEGFSGVDAPYEAPHSPSLSFDTSKLTADEVTAIIIKALQKS